MALPAVAVDEARERYGFQTIGQAAQCRMHFHAITAERRIVHPAVALLTDRARRDLFG